MVNVKWLPSSRLSNHEKLEVRPALSDMHKEGFIDITCRHPASGKMVGFAVSGDTLTESAFDIDLAPFDFKETEGQVKLIIDMLYRDGNNYKVYAQEAFQGKLTRQDLDIILSALMLDVDGFIPHQIGMRDIQADKGWEPEYMEGPDHPWHEVESITIEPAQSGDTSIADLVSACRNILLTDYDSLSATGRLMSEQGTSSY